MSSCNEFDLLHDFFFVQLLVFIAATAFNKRGPHGRLVFTKCVLPSVNKVYYYYYYFIIKTRTLHVCTLSQNRAAAENSMQSLHCHRG